MKREDVKTITDLESYYDDCKRCITFKEYVSNITISEIFLRLIYLRQSTYFKNGKLQCEHNRNRSFDDFIIACNSMLPESEKKKAMYYLDYFHQVGLKGLKFKSSYVKDIVTGLRVGSDISDYKKDKYIQKIGGNTLKFVYIMNLYMRWCPNINKLNEGSISYMFSDNGDANYLSNWSLPEFYKKPLSQINRFSIPFSIKMGDVINKDHIEY
jgi:hypothetical protein